MISAGDDCQVQRWSSNAEPLGRIETLPAPACALAFPASSGGGQAGAGSADDIFAVALADGKVVIMNRSGRVEKTVQAHQGAATCLAWDPDGLAFATGGEEGEVKVWSRAGMLRATIHRGGDAVHAVAWSPDGARLAYATGSTVMISSVEGAGQPLSWKAHDGVVLAMAWNGVTGRIVTGGEDCRFKIWDGMGAPLAKSTELTHVVTSVAWAPQGDRLAVGTYGAVLLCDATGSVLHKQRAAGVGSLQALSWTADGSMVAGAGGAGRVCLGQVVEVTVQDRGVIATLEDPSRVQLVHIDDDGAAEEELQFRESVVAMSAGHGHLVVATRTQLYIYTAGQWQSPHIVDVKGSILFLIQAEKCFVAADSVMGLRVMSYDGRLLSNPKFPGVGPAQFVRRCVAVSNDTLAVVTRKRPSTVEILDTMTGRPAGQAVEHTAAIAEVGLSQGGGAAHRALSVLDQGGDLLVGMVNRGRLVRLASVVSSASWNADRAILAATTDGSVEVWWHPLSAFLDRDLVDVARTSKADTVIGRQARIVGFKGSRVTLAGGDGVPQEVEVGPFAGRLHALAAGGKWGECTRLCRFAKDPSLWATLAGLALAERELSTAESAYGAIQQADRVEFIQHLREVPTEEGRAAELSVFAGEFEVGEEILLRAGLVWRALDLNMAMFRWPRALELAVQHKTHVDTVLLRRAEYLAAAGLEESDAKFLQYGGKVPLDKEAVESKVRQEYEAEASREGARKYQPPPVAAV